jgi:uncharacterized SAM-binding protein YcdF (DUF218 family)
MAYVTHPIYLKGLGQMLVTSDSLARADVIIVLDGDYPQDERFLYAVQLWQRGYAPRIILSAKLADWQTYEDYPTWRHAMKIKNVRKSILEVAPHQADSTKEEAQFLISYMVSHKNRSAIIVTSNYHTRRAKSVFEKAWAANGIRFSFSAAPSSQFHPDDWWKHRSDSRTFFFEFTKVVWYSVME